MLVVLLLLLLLLLFMFMFMDSLLPLLMVGLPCCLVALALSALDS
jgi:hypothetical protein